MARYNLREIATDALIEITEHGQFSHIYMKMVLDKYAYFEKNERAFLTRIVNGCVERKIELDYIIMLYSKTPVSKMKPFIRTILRMGVYEIYYMDGIRAAATCDEYVKLAKKRGFQGLSGFVNGVLRNVARNSDRPLDYPDISTRYSMPQWIVDKWISDYGFDKTAQICEAFLQEAKGLCIRINTALVKPDELKRRLERYGIACALDEDISEAAYISGFDSVTAIAEFFEGMFYIQDYSSMQVAHNCNIKTGYNIIDVCAAPGGKALHAAEIMQGTGHVQARDLTDKKVAIIRENIDRQRASNIDAIQWDATKLDDSAIESADVVIADLPCSGLGIIRKKPDIKYNESKEQLDELCALQRNILDTVCQYVKPGGTLLYSTCTINKDENELQVADFIKRHQEFTVSFEKQLFPSEKHDGFYLCKLQKK